MVLRRLHIFLVTLGGAIAAVIGYFTHSLNEVASTLASPGLIALLGSILGSAGLLVMAVALVMTVREVWDALQRRREEQQEAHRQLSMAEETARADATAVIEATEWAKRHVLAAGDSPQGRQQRQREARTRIDAATARAQASRSRADTLRAAAAEGRLVKTWREVRNARIEQDIERFLHSVRSTPSPLLMSTFGGRGP